MINPVLPLIFLLAGSVLAYAMGRAEYVYKKKYLAAITGLLFFGQRALVVVVAEGEGPGQGARLDRGEDAILKVVARTTYQMSIGVNTFT